MTLVEHDTTDKIRQVLYVQEMVRYLAEQDNFIISDLKQSEYEDMLVEYMESGSYELTRPRRCNNCKKQVELYWSVAVCEKNPEGTKEGIKDHGNLIDGITRCTDDYCNPEIELVENFEITREYVREHNTSLRCKQCHQCMEEP